jgi:hypothetical protein
MVHRPSRNNACGNHNGSLSAVLARLLQEMDECGDDDVFNRLRADLQDVLSFKAGGASANGKFLERYIRQEASFHVHYRVGITPRHTDGGDLCALLEATDYGCGVKPSGGMEILTNGDSGQDCVKVSVFIDIRKLAIMAMTL